MADVLNSGDEPVTNNTSSDAMGWSLLAGLHQPIGVPQTASDRFQANDTSKLDTTGVLPPIEGNLPKWTENLAMSKKAATVFDKSFDNTRRQLINTV